MVRASGERSLPSELLSWAATQSVRIVTRATVQEAIAAARDTSADLLMVECDLVDNNAERLELELMKAQLSGAVLCMGATAQRAAFLAHGADAFVSHRSKLEELLAHATRLLETPMHIKESGLRRPARSVLEVGPIVIELLNRRVFIHRELVRFRPAEFEVLVYLALNRHRTVSAAEIVRDALDTFGDGSSARNQLFELRRKLREAGVVDAIVTERGRGYRMVL